MKKILYTILSICAIIYIAFLSLNIVMAETNWAPDMGWFQTWFDFIVNFGGVAIIFCFALVNFTGNPLKLVFFILLILAIVCYIIVTIAPEWFYNLFSSGGEETVEESLKLFLKI